MMRLSTFPRSSGSTPRNYNTIALQKQKDTIQKHFSNITTLNNNNNTLLNNKYSTFVIPSLSNTLLHYQPVSPFHSTVFTCKSKKSAKDYNPYLEPKAVSLGNLSDNPGSKKERMVRFTYI